MIIISLHAVPDYQVQIVRDILKESKCPHESLTNCCPRYSGTIDGKIFFDDAQSVYSQITAYDMADLLGEIDKVPHICLTVI